MKRISIIIIFAFLALNGSAQQIDFGIGTTLAFTKPVVFGGQAKLAYFVTERFHPSITYTYYIKKNTNYAIDLDARYRLFSIEEYTFSPFAGINLARLGDTRVAVNVGIFTRIDREWFDIYLEPKVVLDDRTYFVLSGGLYF